MKRPAQRHDKAEKARADRASQNQAAQGKGAVWSPPAYLLDVHICEGWGRRPPRFLLPTLSPPSPFPLGTSTQLDPLGRLHPLPLLLLASTHSTTSRSPLTQTKWRRSLPQHGPARMIRQQMEGETHNKELFPPLLEEGHRERQKGVSSFLLLKCLTGLFEAGEG